MQPTRYRSSVESEWCACVRQHRTSWALLGQIKVAMHYCEDLVQGPWRTFKTISLQPGPAYLAMLPCSTTAFGSSELSAPAPSSAAIFADGPGHDGLSCRYVSWWPTETPSLRNPVSTLFLPISAMETRASSPSARAVHQFRQGNLSSHCCLQQPIRTNNTLKADLEVEGGPLHLTVVLQCLDIAAIDEKWHEIATPDARYCLSPYISGFSGAHNCSSVVSALLQAGVPKGACNIIQPGLPDMHCHDSRSGRRLCMHSWAEHGGAGQWTPHHTAKFAMRLKEQEIAMLSSWLGLEVERQAQTLNTVPVTRVAFAENRPMTAFDWAPPSWFQSTGFPAVIRGTVYYATQSEVTPEKGLNLRCTRTHSDACTHAIAKGHARA